MTMANDITEELPLVLTRRGIDADGSACLLLPLTADERRGLRGRRRTACGREVLLQLPRQGPLHRGECLAPDQGLALVMVEATLERQLLVTASSPLDLLKAAYHLGNRHVALELHRDSLRLLEDSVLAEMLRSRGLTVRPLEAAFEPESGAYGDAHHQDAHHQHAQQHQG